MVIENLVMVVLYVRNSVFCNLSCFIGVRCVRLTIVGPKLQNLIKIAHNVSVAVLVLGLSGSGRGTNTRHMYTVRIERGCEVVIKRGSKVSSGRRSGLACGPRITQLRIGLPVGVVGAPTLGGRSTYYYALSYITS